MMCVIMREASPVTRYPSPWCSSELPKQRWANCAASYATSTDRGPGNEHPQPPERAIPADRIPQALLFSESRGDIEAAIRDHQVVILAGETGSGKTTQLPKICLLRARSAATDRPYATAAHRRPHRGPADRR